MADQQFYTVILTTVGIGLMNMIFTGAMVFVLNSRINDLRADMNARFTNLEKLMDQRFESLEQEFIHHRHEDAQ
jgi:hypothetical protein